MHPRHLLRQGRRANGPIFPTQRLLPKTQRHRALRDRTLPVPRCCDSIFQRLRLSEITMAIAAATVKLTTAVNKAPRSWPSLNNTNKAASPVAEAIIIAMG